MDGGGGAGAAVPEELRCKRSDGKQWRCSAPSMPDKTVCEKHYIQAKRRAASSALRGSLKRSSSSSSHHRRVGGGGGGGGGEFDGDAEPPVAAGRPAYYKVAREVAPGHGLLYGLPVGNAARGIGADGAAELVGRGLGLSGGAAGMSCHQCRRGGGNIVWCVSCDRRGYCGRCILRWYSDIALDDIRKVCPACRGICNCRVCLQGDNLIKAKVQEISAIDKLRYLHSLLASVLPVLKQTYADQCFEIGVETRACGPKTDIPRAKLSSDEQMCCDFCKVPVFDYHRHCTKCMYDLCLNCCRDIRRARTNAARGEHVEGNVPERSKDTVHKKARLELLAERTNDRSISQSIDVNNIDFRPSFTMWKANSDSSITCGPVEAGGCSSSKLVLRRIFKINWIAKLVKSSEEMVNGCKVHDSEKLYRCSSCNGGRRLESAGVHHFGLSKCSDSNGTGGNFVYSPELADLKYEGIFHFHKHWINGEPIIIRNAFEPSLSSSWDPLSIWRGIQEILEEKIDEDVIVKAVDCSNQSEVDIELKQFIKGYSDGCKQEDGQPLMLKLKDWPPPSVLEEFLLCQRPEFIVNFPLVDFIHSKWGFLNLAAKLPPDALQPDIGSKLLIAYGSHQELDRGDSVMNLKINMSDVVHMLMHTAEAHNQYPKRLKSERSEKIANGVTLHGNAHALAHNLNLHMGEQSPELTISGSHEKGHASALRLKEEMFLEAKACNGSEGTSIGKFSSSLHAEEKKANASEISQPGALWDVFRRQDVPKLNEYLSSSWKELSVSSQTALSDKHPIYDQAVYLSKYHKRILKDQYGIEPWTFEQHIGEAVFIPAGCPFQVKNLQSTVQLSFDFLSPESLRESARMAQEIRCLPNDHDAKLRLLEVGKISLYAASSAVREIQRISLDPKFSLDIRFEDPNLTAAVSENLARIAKQRKVACT